MMKFRAQFLNPTNWSILKLFSANIVKAGLGFIASILVLQMFSATDVANIYILVSILLLAQSIGDMGLTTSFIHIVSPIYKKSKPQAYSYYKSMFQIKLILSGLIIVLGCLFSLPISRYFFSSEDFSNYVFLVFIFSAVGVMTGFFSSLLQVEQKFSRLSVLKVLPQVAKVSLIIALVAFSQREFKYLFFAFMTVPFSGLIFSILLTGKKFLKAHSNLREHFRVIFSFSMWLVVAGFIGTLFSQVDILMLKRMSTDVEVASFVGGQKVAGVILLVSQALFSVLLPKVANYSKREQLLRYYKKSLVVLPLLIIALVPFVLLAPYIIPFLLGPKYPGSIPIFQILSFQFGAVTVTSALMLILYNKNKVYLISIISLVQLIFNVYLNYILIPSYGAKGAVIASLGLSYLALIVYMVLGFVETSGPNVSSD